MFSFGLYPLALLALLFGQGFLLQLAVAITGEAAPKYGRALKLAFIAGFLAIIATGTFGFTFGWLFSRYVTAVLSGLLWVGVATLVYRRSLGVSGLQAFIVALIQSTLSTVASSVAFYLIGHL
jgi:hypothetical protein